MSEEIKDLKQELNEFDEEYVKLYEKYSNLKKEKRDLQQKVEQLENIRKEAIEYIKEHARIDDEYPAYIEMLLEEKQDLLNILNKGSEYNE